MAHLRCFGHARSPSLKGINHITQRVCFTDWCLFYGLVFVLRIGVCFTNWCLFYKLVFVLQIGVCFTIWCLFYKLMFVLQIGVCFTNWCLLKQPVSVALATRSIAICNIHSPGIYCCKSAMNRDGRCNHSELWNALILLISAVDLSLN